MTSEHDFFTAVLLTCGPPGEWFDEESRDLFRVMATQRFEELVTRYTHKERLDFLIHTLENYRRWYEAQ